MISVINYLVGLIFVKVYVGYFSGHNECLSSACPVVMRAVLFLMVTSAFIGSLTQAQYAFGCTRHVSLPPQPYPAPNYPAPCNYYQPQQPQRPNHVVSYNPYCCPPPIMQQNVVPPPPPPPPPVYQSQPIYVPLPPPPKDCCSAHTTVQQQRSEPEYPSRHPHGHPDPPHKNFTPIPGLSDADSKRLAPNIGHVGSHNTPVVVQSVIVGKKGKETEEEKPEKKEKEESKKKKSSKKKGSEEVDEDDPEERGSSRRNRKRRYRKRGRRVYPYSRSDSYDHDHDHDHDDPSDHFEHCDMCNNGNDGGPNIVYVSS